VIKAEVVIFRSSRCCRKISLLQSVQTGPWGSPCLLFNVYALCSPGSKRPGCEWYSPPCREQLNNTRSTTSASPYALTT